MSVAGQLRSAVEQVTGEIPDIVMLALGLLIIGYFLKPTLGVFNSVKGLLGGSGSASLYPTGTVGSVRSLPNTSQEYQGYGQSYTPIRRFFRQMITEHQM